MKMYLIEEREEVCGNCKHYIEHYIKKDDRPGWSMVTPVNCGHCTYPRMKARTPGNPKCVHFEGEWE